MFCKKIPFLLNSFNNILLLLLADARHQLDTITEGTGFPWLLDAGIRALLFMKLLTALGSTMNKADQTETNMSL